MHYFLNALAGGISVALGGYVYLACESRYLGGFLFSFGMFAVCLFGLPLYTGRVSYLGRGDVKPHHFLSMLPGNILGAVLVGLMYSPVQGGSDVLALVQGKLAPPLFQSFLSAILCGAVIFVIVDAFRRNTDPLGRWLGVLLGVPTFVISRFENSIPDVFYIAAAWQHHGFFEARALPFLFLVFLGNGVGALILHALVSLPKKATSA